MNEAGGIVDDTIINNAGDHIYMVVNGACKYKVYLYPTFYARKSLLSHQCYAMHPYLL